MPLFFPNDNFHKNLGRINLANTWYLKSLQEFRIIFAIDPNANIWTQILVKMSCSQEIFFLTIDPQHTALP